MMKSTRKSTTAVKPPPTPSAPVPASTPATIAELRAACLGADAEFNARNNRLQAELAQVRARTSR